MFIQEKLYTAEEFWDIARLPENAEKRLELDDGNIIEMPPSKPINTIIAGRIVMFFNTFVLPRGLGYVTLPDGGFKLATGRVRQPDVAFISKKRQPEVPAEFEIAPDIAVEIVSPQEDILKKAMEYLKSGTRFVWAVYPDEQMVYVITLQANDELRVQPYNMHSVLDGGDVLPGFKLPVKDIFDI